MTDRSEGKRVVAAGVTAWLVSIPVGAFIHHEIFGAVYAANAAAYRPEPDIVRRLPLGLAGAPVAFLVVAYLFSRLHPERRGIVEGSRFGVLIGVVLVGFAAVGNYVTLPIPPASGVAAAVEYLVPSILCGAIIGASERR